MKSIKNVIFDVGNVFIKWDVNPLFLELLGTQDKVDQFIKDIQYFELNLEFDRGRRYADGVREYSEKFPHYADIMKAIDDRWFDTIIGPIDLTFNILKRLREKGVPTYAITNFSNEKWPIACKNYPDLGTGFIDIVVSGDVKMTKPDLAIYQLLIDRNQLAPQECVFIDDSPANVEAANELGIHGLLFTSAEQFEEDLQDLGVL